MPMTDTWIVRQRPSARTPRLSQMADQSKLASRVIRSGSGRPRNARPPRSRALLAALRSRVPADGVLEVRPLARHVAEERRPVLLRHVALEDARELVAIAHVPDHGVDVVVHRLVPLADPDAPRHGEELVVRQLQCRVLAGNADQEGIVEHEIFLTTRLASSYPRCPSVPLEQLPSLEAVAPYRSIQCTTRCHDGL